jgi:deazaflavin-dependent oxidoreductase (nitroreductase family)
VDAAVEVALQQDKVIDITTTGRKSGEPKRIEIWFHRIEGRYFITGRPGPRSWYANLMANPAFTFHLKESHQVELAASARAILEAGERRTILAPLVEGVGDGPPLDDWLSGAPLVEVTFDAEQ